MDKDIAFYKSESLFTAEGAWNLPSLRSSVFCILLDVLSFSTDFEIVKKKKKNLLCSILSSNEFLLH